MTENTHILSLLLLQLIYVNTLRQRRNLENSRHSYETPPSIYVAFLLNSETRSCLLVDKFHDLGLSISYDEMLVLSTQIGNSIYTQFESDGLISATKLWSNVFITFAVDNIAHNPIPRSEIDSWHGTAICSTQCFESKTDEIKRCSV